MTSERGEGFGFAPAHDAPIPYMQRIRDYYVTLGYGTPYEWAHYAEVPFQPLRKPLAESRVTHRSPRRRPTSPTRATRAPARPTIRRPSSTRSTRAIRPRITTCASRHVGIDRKHTTAEDSGTWFPLPELRRAAGRGPHRLAGAALPRPAHQPQPPRHAGGRLPGDRRALQGRRRRRGDPAAQLPRLPSERQPRRPRAGGGRHPHRGDGLRQGHRRVRRRAAPAVLRLPARQSRGPAEGPGLAGRHAGAGAARAGDGAGRAHHRADRRLPGARAPTGSSTSRTSRRCRPRRSRAAAPSSTGRRRSPRTCARRSAFSAPGSRTARRKRSA